MSFPPVVGIDVVMVTGARRTGSTALGIVLQQIPNFVCIGELRSLWKWGLIKNHRCSCGRRFRDCDFWTAVIREAFGSRGIRGADAVALRQSVERLRFVPQLLFGRLQSERFTQSLRQYQTVLQLVYGAVKRVSGAAVIVDTSKSVTHAIIAASACGIRAHILHLVRDSRAVAFSWRSPKDVTTGVRMEKRDCARVTLSWIASNKLAEVVGRSAHNYFRIRYEDFAENPQTWVENALEAFCLPISQLTDVTTLNNWRASHAVGGNDVRISAGSFSVRPDERWRRGLPPVQRAFVTGLSAMLLLKYGYTLVSARTRTCDT